jgi:hypothetical protein
MPKVLRSTQRAHVRFLDKILGIGMISREAHGVSEQVIGIH